METLKDIIKEMEEDQKKVEAAEARGNYYVIHPAKYLPKLKALSSIQGDGGENISEVIEGIDFMHEMGFNAINVKCPHCRNRYNKEISPQQLKSQSTVKDDLQSRVDEWLIKCFGEQIARDKTERNHRFLEEALELVQSIGCTKSEAHQLVDYTFNRPVGEPKQETGGVVVTLAALCLASGIDMNECGETELKRIWTKIDKIREKQANKPKHSPLPESTVKDGVVKTIGQLITEAIIKHELNPFTIQEELNLPDGILRKLMDDEYYTNSVPVKLFRNLIVSLHIPISEIEAAMIPTFKIVLSKETPESIKKKPSGYALWENEESVIKYLNHFKQLSTVKEQGWVHKFANEQQFLQFLKWRNEQEVKEQGSDD